MTTHLQNIANKIIPIIKNIIMPKNKFVFDNNKYNYCVNKNSWATERTIEIPIILKALDKNKRILELGNVLFQYVKVTWDVVDKYETGKNVINVDIVNFKPKEKYDLIVSISTLEHIGFNENVGVGETFINKKDSNKTIKAINSLKTNCLKPHGKIIATMPLGYNKDMDIKLLNSELGFDKLVFYKRISFLNLWKEVKKEEIVNPQYNYPFTCANYICIGIFKNKETL